MDDRDWNHSFKKAKEDNKKSLIEQDKELIKKGAVKIEEDGDKWTITFLTKFGMTRVVYFTDSGKWHKEKGKAKGLGAFSMIKYFNPLRVPDEAIN